MCDFSNGMKFCTCTEGEIKYREREFYRKVKGELVRIPSKKNDNIPLVYLWRLYRYVGKCEGDAILGHFVMPSEDIGNGLNAEWIALNLNVENCFDFEYTPSEGDNLVIAQNVELSPYISFIFENGEWVEEFCDMFSVIMEFISEGKVKEVGNAI
jgi:hypothetical protein